MLARPSLIVVVMALSSLGASYRTQNFLVEAPDARVARQVGDYAEYYRKEKAMQWLGQEMPNWNQPCPLKVSLTMNGSGGATSFAYDRGRILDMNMNIEGTLDRLLASVLPHEVTHTVFAHVYRAKVPRWADEGGSVLSEDDIERTRHDQLVRQILNTPGRAIPLRRLFQLYEYPNDVMVLYAEGYSVTNFLVGLSNRSVFLNFVGQGMQRGDWDGACQRFYNFRSVEELEKAWVQHLRDTRPGSHPAPTVLASRNSGDPNSQRVVVRQTVPPAQPLLEMERPLTARGQAPEDTEAPNPYPPQHARPVNARVQPMPRSDEGAVFVPAQNQGTEIPPPPPVRLNAPQPIVNQPVQLGQPISNSPR